MVYLYGIVHGGQWSEFFTGRSGEMRIFPGMELLNDLKRFSPGTKVGIESLSEKDWDEVKLHLLKLPFNPPAPRFVEDYEDYALRPLYTQGANVYWDRIKKECLRLEFEVVFLEKKDVWFKYNEATIRNIENEANRRNLLVLEKGESREHYERKWVGFNSEKYKENISIRRIHEIERENQILEAIKSSNVDVAFVGIGHSDYWMTNLQTCSNLGLIIDGYSSEVPREDNSPYGGPTIFTKDAKPDFRMAFGRNSLERAIRLLETQRLSDRKSDFIGTWEINNPMRGYFEMFVDRNGKTIRGEIIDCLGDADFEGEVSDRELRFVKKYKQDRHSRGANLKEITYKGIIRQGNLIGYFVAGGFEQAFYATPEKINDFLELEMSWASSVKRYKKGLKSLREKLFNQKTN